MRAAATLLLSAFVIGCGGGGGGSSNSPSPATPPPPSPPPPPPDASADGAWTETNFHFQPGGMATRYVFAIIMSDGRFFMEELEDRGTYRSDETVGYARGTYTVDNTRLEGRITVHSRSLSNATTFSGTVDEDASITDFVINYSDQDSIRAEFSFAEQNLRPMPVSALSGTWMPEYSWVGPQLTLVIESNGGFYGQDSQGCSWTGTLSTNNPNRNLLNVDFDLEGCPAFSNGSNQNGSYSGLGIVTDHLNYRDNRAFTFLATGGNDQWRWYIDRNLVR